MHGDPNTPLVYEPATEADRIWEAVVFLASIGQEDAAESLVVFRDAHNLRVSQTKVSLADIRHALDQLIVGERTADEIDRWACGLMQAHERGEVVFLPSREEAQIWKGIMMLCGCDMPGERGQPLYGPEDFNAWRDALNAEGAALG
jgi:hypothetical protein